MKVFAFTLSIYIAALSIVPCSDIIEVSKDNNEPEFSVLQREYNHTEHHTDLCTLFCSCACCGSLTTISSAYLIGKEEIVTATYLFPYNFDYSFEYQEGVWHPPTIS